MLPETVAYILGLVVVSVFNSWMNKLQSDNHHKDWSSVFSEFLSSYVEVRTNQEKILDILSSLPGVAHNHAVAEDPDCHTKTCIQPQSIEQPCNDG